jgi:hypothetical protein
MYVATAASMQIVSTATVSSPDLDPDDNNNSVQSALRVNSVDLAATFTESPRGAITDRNLAYGIGITNKARVPASNVTLEVPLPDNVALASAPANCMLAGNALRCDLGTMAANSDARVQIALTSAVAGDLELRSSVAATEPDYDASNNVATVTVAVGSNVQPGTNPPDGGAGGRKKGGGGGAVHWAWLTLLLVAYARRRRDALARSAQT